MRKILEKFMKKYWKNAKNTGKVREIRQSKKVGTMLTVDDKNNNAYWAEISAEFSQISAETWAIIGEFDNFSQI